MVIIPSGYENGTLGSLKPLDGTGDFTFSRGSDISATRVNEDGYIEKGYENLLLQSNTFSDAAWQKIFANVTGGQAGYDGSNDAWKVNSNSIYSNVRQTQNQTGLVTLSVYAKKGEYDYVGLYFSGNVVGVIFSLIDGGVENPIFTYPDIYANGESVGNGWYRFSITHNLSNTGRAEIFVCETTSYNGNTTTGEGIYIQDAMLNQGMVAYPYVETTTAPVAGGILEDMPRLDYSGSCASLKLEPQRTNLVEYSEYFGGWDIRPIYTNTTAQNKEGRDINSLYGLSAISIILPSAGTYAYSVYAKKDTWDFLVLRDTNFATTSRTWFDLANGVVTSAGSSHGTPTITPEGDGWYRCTIYLTASTDLIGNVVFTQAQTSGSFTDGTNDQEAIFVDMAQCEEGSYPTSYIPTYGTSQTRLRDTTATLSSPAIAGATEFTWFFDNTNATIVPAALPIFWLKSNTDDNLIYFATQGGRFYSLPYFGFTNSVGKVCVKYDGTTFTMFLNGEKSTDTLTKSFGTTSELLALNYANEGFSGPLHQMLFFKTALSDDECIELTTI